MSWSLDIPANDASSFASAAHVAREAFTGPDDGATDHQVDRAVAAAAALVASGAVGVDCQVAAYLSGHANPNHDPDQGSAEQVVITVQYAGPNPDPRQVAIDGAKAAEAAEASS